MHLFIVYNILTIKALTHELTKILLYFILKSPPLTPGPQTPPEQKAHAVPVAPA